MFCATCWWYSDERTGLCCNEDSGKYLRCVRDGGACEKWLGRELKEDDAKEWEIEYHE